MPVRKKTQDQFIPGRVTLADELDALQGDPNFMLTLGRGLAVLGAFGIAKRKLNIGEISRVTGIPAQAVRRCLYTLCKLGFMGQDGAYFSPRPRLLALGYVFFATTPFDRLAQPVVDELHEELGMACSIGVFDADEVTYMVRTGGGRQFTTNNFAGLNAAVPDRRPAYCTAPGRVLLAALSEEHLDAYLFRTELSPLTDHTLCTAEGMRAALERVREQDYAIVDQEVAIGLRSIAVPLCNPSGTIIAALGAAAIAAQWSVADLRKTALPALRRAARSISLDW